MKEGAEFGVGQVLAQALWLARDKPQGALLAAGVLIALGIGADMLPDDSGSRLTLPIGIISLLLQYQVMRDRLDRLGLIEPGFQSSRFFPFLGLSVLTTLAILLGFALLIVPGLLLLARWAVAGPALIAENLGVFAAMRRSWDDSRGRFWTIFLVLLVVYAPLPFLFLGLGAGLFLGMEEGLPMIVALNGVTNIVIVFGWYAAVALYAHMRQGVAGVADIFA